MSLFGKIFKEGGMALAQPVEAVGNVIDQIFTSKEEKLSHDEVMARIAAAPTMVQTEINKIEAQHRSVFVAGWRPFIGWVCGYALLYNYVIRDMINYVIVINWPGTDLMPALQMEHLMTVLTGMLGLATLRTVEKFNGKTK